MRRWKNSLMQPMQPSTKIAAIALAGSILAGIFAFTAGEYGVTFYAAPVLNALSVIIERSNAPSSREHSTQIACLFFQKNFIGGIESPLSPSILEG
jgi:hypothetical protein